MSASLNNCSTQFNPNGCFTSAAQASTTATVTPDAWAAPLSAFAEVMAIVFFVLIFYFAFLNGYTIMRQGYLGRRAPAQTPEPREGNV